MDADIRIRKRRDAFIKRRTKVWDEVMKDYPEGLTKENLQAIQQKVKAKERAIKRGEREK